MPDVLSWDLKELKDLVREKYGPRAAEELEFYISSISKKINIAAYHSLESRELLKVLFAQITEDYSYSHGLKLMFGVMTANVDEDLRMKSSLFYNNSWKAEAHVVACAYAVLSVIDIMAQVINCTLDLKIPVNDVTVYKVKGEITEYDNLLKKTKELLCYDEYKYLQAFVNSQKHVFFIPITYTFKMQAEIGEKAHGLKIPSFKFNGKSYCEKWSDDFVTTEFVKVKDKVLEIGIELNSILKLN